MTTGRYGTLGEVFFVADSFWPLNTSLYVQDFKGNDPRFSAYFLKTVLTKRSSDKAAVPGVNRNDLHKLSVRVTRDMGKQRTIASILSTYDDLIENNQRRIRLLEQTARLLYKEWFVHLRFPGHEYVTVTDGVPEGWEKKPLFEVATPTYGFAFKSKLFNSDSIGLPVTRIRDVPVGHSQTYTTEQAPEGKLLEDGDFVVGMDGDFHMNFWTGGKGVPPKLIIFNGVLGGARAPHCQERRLQRDRFATTMTILNRSDCFGAARAGSEWPARHAHSSACPNA